MKKRKAYNPKRRMAPPPASDDLRRALDELSGSARYGGNPEHKRNPGDFGLSPPVAPRPAKTLCDEAGLTSRKQAKKLLKDGIKNGLVSIQKKSNWPQNVWAVTENGVPMEGQLENAENGTYHGYPMPVSDPFRTLVLQRWQESNDES